VISDDILMNSRNYFGAVGFPNIFHKHFEKVPDGDNLAGIKMVWDREPFLKPYFWKVCKIENI
jgi:hypothetical protein